MSSIEKISLVYTKVWLISSIEKISLVYTKVWLISSIEKISLVYTKVWLMSSIKNQPCIHKGMAHVFYKKSALYTQRYGWIRTSENYERICLNK
jgi:hypothetical protein